MHNKDERVTIVKQGSLALTFETSHDDTMELKYHIDSQVCNVILAEEDLYI